MSLLPSGKSTTTGSIYIMHMSPSHSVITLTHVCILPALIHFKHLQQVPTTSVNWSHSHSYLWECSGSRHPRSLVLRILLCQ